MSVARHDEAAFAQLLQVPLNEPLRDLTGPFNNVDYVVTYRAERNAEGDVQHILGFATGEGSRAEMSVGTLYANPEKNGDDSLTFPIGSNSPSGTTAIFSGTSRSSCPDAIVPRQGTKGISKLLGVLRGG